MFRHVIDPCDLTLFALRLFSFVFPCVFLRKLAAEWTRGPVFGGTRSGRDKNVHKLFGACWVV